VAYPKLIHRSLRKWTVHRLNAHKLMLLSIEVGLEGTAIRRCYEH
jgi:hypothetical protein